MNYVVTSPIVENVDLTKLDDLTKLVEGCLVGLVFLLLVACVTLGILVFHVSDSRKERGSEDGHNAHRR